MPSTLLDKRCQRQFQEKLLAGMEREGLAALLLTSPELIFYSTGYLSCMYGRGEPIGTDVAVVLANGRTVLITSQFTRGGAELQTKGQVELLSYPTYIFIEDYYDPNETEKPAAADRLTAFRLAAEVIGEFPGQGAIGMERATLSYDQYSFLQQTFGEERLTDAEALLIRIRSIKTPWEIDALRQGAQVVEKMMTYTMTHTQEGMTEADIFRLWWQSAYEITGGHEVFNVRQAHTVGPDFWCTTIARERPIQQGDIIRLDGGITLAGYLADLGRTYAVGKQVVPQRQAIFDTLLRAYDTGISMMEPGVRICDVFQAVLKVCHEGALPQLVRGHVGHSIGLGPSEEAPTISPQNQQLLEPGMVFCFEIPYYSSQFGSYNLEDTLVITENGHELFTHTNRTLLV